MSLRTRIRGFTSWVNLRLLGYDHLMNNVIMDLLTGTNMKYLIQSITGRDLKRLQSFDEYSCVKRLCLAFLIYFQFNTTTENNKNRMDCWRTAEMQNYCWRCLCRHTFVCDAKLRPRKLGSILINDVFIWYLDIWVVVETGLPWRLVFMGADRVFATWWSRCHNRSSVQGH